MNIITLHPKHTVLSHDSSSGQFNTLGHHQVFLFHHSKPEDDTRHGKPPHNQCELTSMLYLHVHGNPLYT